MKLRLVVTLKHFSYREELWESEPINDLLMAASLACFSGVSLHFSSVFPSLPILHAVFVEAALPVAPPSYKLKLWSVLLHFPCEWCVEERNVATGVMIKARKRIRFHYRDCKKEQKEVWPELSFLYCSASFGLGPLDPNQFSRKTSRISINFKDQSSSCCVSLRI